MYDIYDTITAISTAIGNAGISVIRISGKDATAIASKVFFRANNQPLLFEPYHFYYGFVKDLSTGNIIDEALLLYMKAPKSYTGEDVIEIQCHGGIISTTSILESLIKAGARLAKEGEFTYRAFLNGKKDLTQAEAIETLIHSKTKLQHQNALKQLSGYYKKELHQFFEYIEHTRNRLEAEINFPEDMEEMFSYNENIINKLHHKLVELAESYNEKRYLSKGILSLILGKPNVGKSSFLNEILSYERAIVSEIPGTTRDFIEETILFEGIPLKIIDTAGIRSSEDEIEKIGIERALSFVKDAKIIFAIFDISEPLNENDSKIIEILKNKKDAVIFALANKADKNISWDLKELPFENRLTISLKQGQGVNDLRKIFRQKILDIYKIESEDSFFVASERHYNIIKEMIKITEHIKMEYEDSFKLLLSLSSLLSLYNNLIGREFDPRNIEDIFKKFCIGK